MSRNWKQSLFVLPSLGLSVLPKFICPICWPAYAGLLSSVGLGFLVSGSYAVPLTIGFLAVAVGTLAFRTTKRHGYGPFQLGLVAAITILLSKFVWEYAPTIYGAVGLLVLASIWNAWPLRSGPSHGLLVRINPVSKT